MSTRMEAILRIFVMFFNKMPELGFETAQGLAIIPSVVVLARTPEEAPPSTLSCPNSKGPTPSVAARTFIHQRTCHLQGRRGEQKIPDPGIRAIFSSPHDRWLLWWQHSWR